MGGIDLNPGVIEVGQQHSPRTGANVAWCQGDLIALSFPGGAGYNRQNGRGSTFGFHEIEGIFQIIQVKTPIAIVHLCAVLVPSKNGQNPIIFTP